jgi:hypothetical protein
MVLNNITDSSTPSFNFNHCQRRNNSSGNKRRQKRKNINRVYKRRAYNNEDILSQITQLPMQITNSQFAFQLFYGSPFY